jgi:hypothetical protein
MDGHGGVIGECLGQGHHMFGKFLAYVPVEG